MWELWVSTWIFIALYALSTLHTHAHTHAQTHTNTHRRNNYIIRNLHERCLTLIYNYKNSFYEELLTKDGSVSIHIRNIQALAVELFKIKKKLSPEIFTEIFARETETYYKLRRCNDIRIPSIHTVYHGLRVFLFTI